MKNTGIGRGEIMIAWIFKGATISGGSQSYDISINGNKYEVKELGNAKAVKVGTEGMISKFDFGREIVDTLRRMDKLTSNDKIKIESLPLTDEELKAWKSLSDDYLVDKVMSGEISASRIELFKNFYQVFSQSKIDDLSGFTNMILRGPYQKPVELSIEPIRLEEIKPGDQITIKVSSSDLGRLYMMTELRRLRYIRNPEQLEIDIQAALDTLVGNKSFIFFKNNGEAHVTNKIKFDATTQGRMKVGPA